MHPIAELMIEDDLPRVSFEPAVVVLQSISVRDHARSHVEVEVVEIRSNQAFLVAGTCATSGSSGSFLGFNARRWQDCEFCHVHCLVIQPLGFVQEMCRSSYQTMTVSVTNLLW